MPRNIDEQTQGHEGLREWHPSLDAAKDGSRSDDVRDGQTLDVGFLHLGMMCQEHGEFLVECLLDVHEDGGGKVLGCRSLVEKDVPDIALSLIHISEPTRLGMISYAVFCLKK